MGLEPLHFWSRVFFAETCPIELYTFPNLSITPGRGNSMRPFQRGGLVKSHGK